MVVIECKCSQQTITNQQEYRNHCMPNTWLNIQQQFNQLTLWQHNNVLHKQINTDNSPAYNITHQILIPLIAPLLPTSSPTTTLRTFFSCKYEVVKDLLGPNILSFLRLYAQQQTYMKEEGLIHGTVRQNPCGIRVEGNLGCGIAYKQSGIDAVTMHPMVR